MKEADVSSPQRAWNFKDLTGKTFGSLTVEGLIGIKNRTPYWQCLCRCGRTHAASSQTLRFGGSCGCLKKERIGALRRSHGKTGSPEFHSWSAMNQRCSNTKNKKFPSYGGRGITVCDRWRNSFEDFLSDVGPQPSAIHTIDRWPNNDGNYEPGNCRWATPRQQANNRRSSKILELNGESKTLAQWCRQTGLRSSSVLFRLQKGWSVKDALTKPSRSLRCPTRPSLEKCFS